MPRKRKPDPEKYCGYCKKRLQRKTMNGRLEDYGVFTRRKYCDVLCMAKAKMKQEATAAAYRKRAAHYRAGECSNCGSKDNLHIHHLDGDMTNNALANLMTLCGSCHGKWHWANGKSIPKRQRKSCSICGRPAKAMGYCQNHYRHYLLYGNPLLTKHTGGRNGPIVREDA